MPSIFWTSFYSTYDVHAKSVRDGPRPICRRVTSRSSSSVSCIAQRIVECGAPLIGHVDVVVRDDGDAVIPGREERTELSGRRRRRVPIAEVKQVSSGGGAHHVDAERIVAAASASIDELLRLRAEQTLARVEGARKLRILACGDFPTAEGAHRPNAGADMGAGRPARRQCHASAVGLVVLAGDLLD